MTNPIFAYGRTGGCASITGGAFVPDGVGWPASSATSYLYADYVCGKIVRLNQDAGGNWQPTDFVTGLGGVERRDAARSGRPAAGQSLYYTTYAGGGQLRRIDATDWQPPTGRRSQCLAAERQPAADRDLQRDWQHRPGRRPAHVQLRLRRQLRGPDAVVTVNAHLHRAGTYVGDAARLVTAAAPSLRP